MLGKELAALIKDGVHPVVTFRPSVLVYENYMEPGMRGRLVSISNERDDMFRLLIDFTEFDEFNQQFESRNYYDKNGVPCLTARESGYYKGSGHIYVDNDSEVDFFEIEESERLKLHVEFQAGQSDKTYLQWLEDMVLAQRAAT